MSLDIAENCFDTGFEEDVVITAASGPQTIKAHFHSKYVVANLFNMNIEAASPMVEVMTDDCPDVKNGDALVYKGKTYFVKERQPDSDGFTFIILAED
jgi:hypothetical protein